MRERAKEIRDLIDDIYAAINASKAGPMINELTGGFNMMAGQTFFTILAQAVPHTIKHEAPKEPWQENE